MRGINGYDDVRGGVDSSNGEVSEGRFSPPPGPCVWGGGGGGGGGAGGGEGE
jgi:hypothetical protein